ncbi:hypothetical protein Hanom_Chr11g00970971 [Helianthus anomalus]
MQKHEVVQTKSVKINVKNVKQQHIWKKIGNCLGGAQPIPSHREIEAIILDDTGPPKSTKSWVPLSN